MLPGFITEDQTHAILQPDSAQEFDKRTFDLGGAVTLRLENQEGEGDHLQLFPAGVNVEAVLAGALIIGRPFSCSSIAVRLYCTKQSFRYKPGGSTIRSGPHPGPSSTSAASYVRTADVLYHTAETLYTVPRTEEEELTFPFRLTLPKTHEGEPMPPSFQQGEDGIRYFLQIKVDRTLLSLDRKCRAVLPIVYLPISRHPSDPIHTTLPIGDQSSPIRKRSDPERTYVEASEPLADEAGYMSVFIPKPAVFARGGSVEVFVKVAFIDPKKAEKLIPPSLTIELIQCGHSKPSSPDPTSLSLAPRSEFYPIDILPPITSIPPTFSPSFAGLQTRAFFSTLPIPNEITPSFKVFLGPSCDYSVKVSIKLGGKNVVGEVKVPLKVVNCSREEYELPKAYYRKDTKGGMGSKPNGV